MNRIRLSAILALASSALFAACVCANRVADTASDNSFVTRTGPGLEVDRGSESIESAPDAGSASGTIAFRGREIDLAPHIRGFPYRSLHVDGEGGRLFYIEKTDGGDILKVLPLAGDVDLAAGRQLNDVDWSTRNLWHYWSHVDEASGRLFAMADEANEERMNVYAISMSDGSVEQITDNDYTYGFSFSPDGGRLAYIARRGVTEPFNSCLMLRDLRSGDEREVWCDGGGADRFTWSDIHFQYEHSDDAAHDNVGLTHALLTVQHDGDRNKENIARIDLRSGELELLLERGVDTYKLWIAENGVFGDAVHFVSAAGGVDAVYRYNVADGSVVALAEFEHPIDHAELAVIPRGPAGSGQSTGTEPALVVMTQDNRRSVLSVHDGLTGAELEKATIEAMAGVAAISGGSIWTRASSARTPFEMYRIDTMLRRNANGSVDSFEMDDRLVVTVPDEVLARIQQCEVSEMSYRSFDGREITGLYYAPKSPLEGADRRVRITAFYGGANHWSNSSQIMCEAGIATLSPAPRGSSGFGAEFSALNDGDLGGDEIIDLFYAARWLEQEQGFSPEQIGVYGGSHGGYATMRALTFPPDTNGRGEGYDFGFGISHAGFSDIISFYEECNIPDWVILEAGDPADEAEKLRDRSPISHVERLRAPILLTHGENDSRVPVEESRRFARRARELDRPVTYVEFAGQGHGISGLDNAERYYRAVLDFMSEVIDSAGQGASPPR